MTGCTFNRFKKTVNLIWSHALWRVSRLQLMCTCRRDTRHKRSYMSQKKYIQLPKGYLSHSQIVMWKSSKERYKKLYFNGQEEYRLNNKFLDYGKKFATALEFERDTNELLTDAAILLLPKYDVRDQEIVAEIKTKHGWLKVVGRPDTFNSKTFEFREYKTGMSPWTHSKAQRHHQMRFYAMIIYLKHKKALADAYLDWIETEKLPDGTIQPTGKTKSFKVEIGLSTILQTINETIQTALEIELAYASHVPPPEEEF